MCNKQNAIKKRNKHNTKRPSSVKANRHSLSKLKKYYNFESENDIILSKVK